MFSDSVKFTGVKESVLSLTPIFIVFICTHVIAIIYGIFIHSSNFTAVATQTSHQIHATVSQFGYFATFLSFSRRTAWGPEHIPELRQ